MNLINKVAISAILTVLFSFKVSAQDAPDADTTDILNMSFDQLILLKSKGLSSEMEALINQQIAVSVKNPLSVRKSPNIISLITEEEIKKSGARDLTDVLRTFPGLDFGVDVQGQIGLGVRGSWANEGKILILLDGQEMNEIAYGTLQFGNNYPLEQIKKIEIIRGPGSAVYGGFAEYMVYQKRK